MSVARALAARRTDRERREAEFLADTIVEYEAVVARLELARRLSRVRP